MHAISERHVIVEVDGERCRGRLDGETVVLENGSRVDEPVFLAPVASTKILAVHLGYLSRIEEYRARGPNAPSYFMKPPSALNGHRGAVRRPEGAAYACANDVGRSSNGTST
jgi:5-oxopent-3-ene-1,2,5-tricarboxylate decarboxylase / 2-hydroxyhepta-2,4-diene-1,7-dioate isomerase